MALDPEYLHAVLPPGIGKIQHCRGVCFTPQIRIANPGCLQCIPLGSPVGHYSAAMLLLQLGIPLGDSSVWDMDDLLMVPPEGLADTAAHVRDLHSRQLSSPETYTSFLLAAAYAALSGRFYLSNNFRLCPAFSAKLSKFESIRRWLVRDPS